jgi:hypothetical protein
MIFTVVFTNGSLQNNLPVAAKIQPRKFSWARRTIPCPAPVAVVEIPDSLPNTVGQNPLEDLDWVVDCRNQKLIPNPEHKNGELADEF